MDQVKVQLTCS